MGCNSDTCPIGSSFVPPAAIGVIDTAPSGCPCDHKGNRSKGGFFGGSVHSPTTDRSTPSFAPQLPPSVGRETKRPVAIPPPSNGRTPPPSDKGTPSFTPTPPPPSLLPPVRKQGGGKGNLLTPPVIIDVAPPLPPVSLPPPAKQTDLGGGAPSPVPFVNTVPLGTVGQDVNPFAPYCGNGIDAASELCRAAGNAGLSDYCKQQLLAFLKSGSSMTLGQWIATNELCDQAALRRAVGIAEASMNAKASAGLYDKPGFGNPFGVDGYAWSQDRVVKPSPYMQGGNGTTMDWRKPSGGMPNYYRASAGPVTSQQELNDILAAQTAQDFAEGRDVPRQYGFNAADIQAFNASQAGSDLYRQELAQAAAASPPATPPVDYAAIIGGAATALGTAFAGINTAVNNAAQNRLRVLEIEYANNARGAQLALQRSQMEMTAEIARLNAQGGGGGANAQLVTALQQQVADTNARIQQLTAPDTGMSTSTTVALVAGGLAVAGGIAYVVLSNKRGRR